MGERCQYGVFQRCGTEATTKRQRPNGDETWNVCDRHAQFLDRLRKNIEQHSDLLRRLSDG